MNKSAHARPFVLIVIVSVMLFVSCFATILYAAFSITRDTKGENVAVVGTLKSSVSAGTITVQNDMDCVMRASTSDSSLTFSSTEWFKQDNGWYYYYRVIGKTDSNKTISLTGATADNVVIELMQAQYLPGTKTIKAGFLREWSTRDLSIVDNDDVETWGAYTPEGVDITNDGAYGETYIVVYSGLSADRRVTSSSYGSGTNRLKATYFKSEDYYTFNKINLGTGSTYEDISETNKNTISIYNNSNISVVYMIQVVSGSGTQPNKSSQFSNGNWTTYTENNNKYTLAADSTDTSYNTYFISRAVNPGEHIDLTNGSDNQLYFDDLSDNETSISMVINSVDTTTFVYRYDTTATSTDNYLAWLKSLDANKTGATFYSDFINIFS